jgi:hypothetical protein
MKFKQTSLYQRLKEIYKTINNYYRFNFCGSIVFFVIKRTKIKSSYVESKFCSINNNQKSLFLITVAFNDEILIQKQIEAMKEFIKDNNYCHIIVDNSSVKAKRKEIANVCKKQNITYIPVPKIISCRISKISGNISHGTAMNWAYYNIINVIKPEYFGFIDHDLFPVENYHVMNKLCGQDMYGTLRNRMKGWYIWAGFCFYKYAFIKDIQMNFLPKVFHGEYFDTGGANHSLLYKYHNYKKLRFSSYTTFRIQNFNADIYKDNNIFHNNCIQIIDDSWVHIVHASCMQDKTLQKNKIEYVLNNYKKMFIAFQSSKENHCE